jgi:hypothetical protein
MTSNRPWSRRNTVDGTRGTAHGRTSLRRVCLFSPGPVLKSLVFKSLCLNFLLSFKGVYMGLQMGFVGAAEHRRGLAPFPERLAGGRCLFTVYLWGKPLAPSAREGNSGRGQNSPVDKP